MAEGICNEAILRCGRATSYVCCTLTPGIPDLSFLRMNGRELAELGHTPMAFSWRADALAAARHADKRANVEIGVIACSLVGPGRRGPRR
jgi:hypothetical protein